jgi:hypothetical protein
MPVRITGDLPLVYIPPGGDTANRTQKMCMYASKVRGNALISNPHTRGKHSPKECALPGNIPTPVGNIANRICDFGRQKHSHTVYATGDSCRIFATISVMRPYGATRRELKSSSSLARAAISSLALLHGEADCCPALPLSCGWAAHLAQSPLTTTALSHDIHLHWAITPPHCSHTSL